MAVTDDDVKTRAQKEKLDEITTNDDSAAEKPNLVKQGTMAVTAKVCVCVCVCVCGRGGGGESYKPHNNQYVCLCSRSGGVDHLYSSVGSLPGPSVAIVFTQWGG